MTEDQAVAGFRWWFPLSETGQLWYARAKPSDDASPGTGAGVRVRAGCR